MDNLLKITFNYCNSGEDEGAMRGPVGGLKSEMDKGVGLTSLGVAMFIEYRYITTAR
jgi:hypothetical protein